MLRDDRFLSVTIANASGLRSSIRSFKLHKRWIKVAATFVFVIAFIMFLGFYGLFQNGYHLRTLRENEKLRAEKEKLQKELIESHKRIEAGEEKLKKLAEMSGVSSSNVTSSYRSTSADKGAGGPAISVDSWEAANALKVHAIEMELKLKAIEATLKEKVKVPSIWPLQGLLNDNFGARHSPFGGASYEFHLGQDIKVGLGTPVAATAEGVVSFAGPQSGYGILVSIEHRDGFSTRYGHLSKVMVKQGQKVKCGEIVALSGNTGRSTGPHLHYEVRINDEPVNPATYLPNYKKMPRKK